MVFCCETMNDTGLKELLYYRCLISAQKMIEMMNINSNTNSSAAIDHVDLNNPWENEELVTIEFLV